MSVVLLLMVFAASSCMTITGNPLNAEYNHSVFMDPDEKYQLHWSIRGDRIHMAVQVNTTGWVGLGIAKGLAGKMKDADIVIGYVVDDQGYLTDRFAEGNFLPKLDSSQDYSMEAAEETDGQTILKFNRKMTTCDESDHAIVEGTLRMLYSYSDTDPRPGEERTIQQHNWRGSKSMNLRSYIGNSPIPTGTPHVDILGYNVLLPNASTVYWCSVHKMPDFGGKRHVIEIEPRIQPGHESLAHHMVLYGCSPDFDQSHENESQMCHTQNMPPTVRGCIGASALFSWAIGSKNFKLPDHVGIPIGVPGTSRFYVLEVHYDNPAMKSGIIDASGLRLHYTDRLRQYDSGTIVTGSALNDALVIPPKQSHWRTSGYCPSECSMKLKSPTAINGDTVNIFGVLPHSHLAGRELYASIVRNHTEISRIVSDKSYDFNFQQTLVLEQEVPLSAGDGIVTTCVYDTLDRATATWGGFSVNEEMCVTFLMYYPLQDLTGCTSTENNVNSVFKTNYPEWKTDSWNATMLKDFEKSINYGYSSSICTGMNSTVFMDISFRPLENPTIINPLPAPSDPCMKKPGNSGASAVITAVEVIPFVISMLSSMLLFAMAF